MTMRVILDFYAYFYYKAYSKHSYILEFQMDNLLNMKLILVSLLFTKFIFYENADAKTDDLAHSFELIKEIE